MDESATPAVAVVHEFVGGARAFGDALTELSELATEAMHADMAGLTLLTEQGRATTIAYTDQMVPEIDKAQYDSDRGPCLEAFREGRSVHVVNTAAEARWPEFAEAAARHGIATSLSLPVIVGERVVGALNFYARLDDVFDDDDTAIGTLYARHVATVAAFYDRAEEADHLQRALESRAEIDQAKGIVMATTRCSADEAFDLLRQQSQNENRKLREVATDLVAQQQQRART